MATDQYAAGYVFLDGALLVEELSCDLDYDANNSVQVTQAKGFAGISPGAGRFTARVTNAIPRAGLEVDFYTLAKDRTPVEFIVAAAGKKRISKGFIMRVSEKFGADTSSTIDFEFEGDEPEVV
jgi:hypothetical protein